MKVNRGFRTKKEFKNPKSKQWDSVSEVFRKNRWVKWETISVPKDSGKKKRMEFRARQITGILKNFGDVQLICSEFKKSPKGKRKYLACNDLKATVRQILVGYRIRWRIEIFHKEVKMFMGFEDISTISFDSVISHVHWVYCAYILMRYHLADREEEGMSVSECQSAVKSKILKKNMLRVKQLLTRINGVNSYKKVLEKALAEKNIDESFNINLLWR